MDVDMDMLDTNLKMIMNPPKNKLIETELTITMSRLPINRIKAHIS